ncbi:cuticular protein RR-2 motif 139 precursor [Bombyx mori]|uniref:Putative cuticle protein n=1 Tax=Bombyx mori TaxID=7091 RepID=C0H6Y1_BOMMO|nr:cuticular protein RR-2 motif 139 precursor [Bombyx mori]FAA00642.1 TPA: putative cuticle protein [Bombyx mori]
MFRILCITLLALSTLLINTSAQEYLPPKVGLKKSIAEPTLPANYDFAYDVQDNAVSLDFGHNEKRKDDHASGSYHVLLPDGRTQLVEYEAGPDGYKPQVMYMGTATFPAAGSGDKFDGYHYNAASNRQSVRQIAPRTPRQPSTQAPTGQQSSNNATQ